MCVFYDVNSILLERAAYSTILYAITNTNEDASKNAREREQKRMRKTNREKADKNN
jgi:hypothetical protein